MQEMVPYDLVSLICNNLFTISSNKLLLVSLYMLGQIYHAALMLTSCCVLHRNLNQDVNLGLELWHDAGGWHTEALGYECHGTGQSANIQVGTYSCYRLQFVSWHFIYIVSQR